MLLSRDACAAAAQGCAPSDFYKPSHATIFSAIMADFRQGRPVDAVTVATYLKDHQLLESIGGPAQLIALQSNTPAISNAKRYAEIISEDAKLRRLVWIGAELQELGYESPEIGPALERSSTLISELHAQKSAVDTLSADQITSSSLEQLRKMMAGEMPIALPTGLLDLDALLGGGLRPDELVVLGARPSMGKTALALAVALSVAERKTPVLWFSLEMGHFSLWQRAISSLARIDAGKIRSGNLAAHEIAALGEASEKFASYPFFINDSPNTSLMDVRAEAIRTKMHNPSLGLIVVDYLQLMSSNGAAENRQLEIAEIVRGLKTLAREIQVPVLALSQLSRNLESRSNKHPVLSDFRESGEIEQAADIALGLYRDEVYEKDTPDRGVAEVEVLKNRNGPIGTARLAFISNLVKFGNMAKF